MNYYDLLLAKKLSGGSGGGGGDFSTAEVTLICSGGDGYASNYMVEFSTDDESSELSKGGFVVNDTVGIDTEPIGWLVNYGTNALVKTYCLDDFYPMVYYDGLVESADYFVITGNAEVVTFVVMGENYYGVKVKGDCTISTEGYFK